MVDTGNIYLGARLTYQDIMENEEVPFKIKAIVERYIVSEIDSEVSLESHFYYMEKESFSYKTFQQMKTRVKVSIPTVKKTISGKSKSTYETKIMKLEEFVVMPPSYKEEIGIMIQEIILNKLSVLTFAI